MAVSKKELQAKLSAAQLWAAKEFDAWVEDLVTWFPNKEDFEEPASFEFEDLPEALGEFDEEGSMEHDIVTYRLKEGITDIESQEFWWESPPFQWHLRQWLMGVREYGDENERWIFNAVHRLKEFGELIKIIVDDEDHHLQKHAERWQFPELKL